MHGQTIQSVCCWTSAYTSVLHVCRSAHTHAHTRTHTRTHTHAHTSRPTSSAAGPSCVSAADAAAAAAAAAAEIVQPYQWSLPCMGTMPQDGSPPLVRLPPIAAGSSFEREYEVRVQLLGMGQR
eukprot:258486-Pelagomonas_calceolata.AAC.3